MHDLPGFYVVFFVVVVLLPIIIVVVFICIAEVILVIIEVIVDLVVETQMSRRHVVASAGLAASTGFGFAGGGYVVQK